MHVDVSEQVFAIHYLGVALSSFRRKFEFGTYKNIKF